MFRWYRDAARCFVYLSDVSTAAGLSQDSDKFKPSWKEAFEKSRWFHRGWTLQELLAPASVQFFSKEGILLGDKESLEPEIHSITKIPIPALRKGARFDQFDVDERLIWAAKRQTTREEDWAYCLLGIFGVFMPLLYGEGRDKAVSRLRKEIDNTPKRQEWLRKLYVCPYQDRKDRNPQRVERTCKWFTSHTLFRNWQQSNAASLLWVSADPGCGKSVLAKYLADEVLPSTITRTTCYFFFKEDFEDQKSSIAALCSMLHQIFDQYPASFSTEILEKFEDKGSTLLSSFRDLWDILISATTGHKRREVVCIFDALDECEGLGRHQLIEAISKFYSSKTTRPALKLLLTSRPYQDIRRGFYFLERDLPTIHLSGENEEEVQKIAREIDLVVENRVMDVGKRLGLLREEQDVLREELTRAPNRTYLWVYLIFDIITNSIIDGLEDIPSIVKMIPKTVDAAYERILLKSPDVEQARRLLHIIVAATRPLTLQEIALALAIKPHHRTISDLKLGPNDRICHNIRQHCGLFVVVVDSKVYLLHQTAREFLVPPLFHRPSIAPHNGTALQWKFSLHPRESSRILAEICVQRLSFSDFSLRRLEASPNREQYIAKYTLLGYAASSWAGHFRESEWEMSDWVARQGLSYFNPKLPASSAWFEIYQLLTTGVRPQTFTPLAVASYFGLSVVVTYLLETGADVDAKDKGGMTPLYWASSEGHDTVVQQLLDAGADVYAKDEDGMTPLHCASSEGYETVVRQLLDVGADANAKDEDGWTPLHYASFENKSKGYASILELLLDAGADINAKDNDDCTPLWKAISGHINIAIVRQLLDAGAEVNAKGKDGRTPLHWVSSEGHDTVVRQLLDAGADVDAKDKGGMTPLYWASSEGHDTVVRQLLDAGADVDAKDKGGKTPLYWASSEGHDTMVRQLLDAGADVNTKEENGSTPLRLASRQGYGGVVQQRLDDGTDAIHANPEEEAEEEEEEEEGGAPLY